jgi:hypothetical protein
MAKTSYRQFIMVVRTKLVTIKAELDKINSRVLNIFFYLLFLIIATWNVNDMETLASLKSSCGITSAILLIYLFLDYMLYLYLKTTSSK